MSSHHAPRLPYCRNCHFTLSAPRPRHCGHCGQETDLHPPSVREMLTEYLGHYVAFDGPLWRTLWALICLPGYLTNAYFHGARRRYVLPLRVYLSASFLFFVGSHLLPHTADEADIEDAAEAIRIETAEPGKPVKLRVKPGATPAQTAAEAARIAASAASQPVPEKKGSRINICDDKAAGCSGTQRTVDRLLHNAENMTGEQWQSRLRALAPYGMLAMQPLFAALLLAMFAGSGRRYAEHFVFSLHTHSLWFLALLVANAGGAVSLMLPAVFVHGLVAMRRVYRLDWGAALWRGVLLSLGYLLLLTLGMAALAAGIAATA